MASEYASVRDLDVRGKRVLVRVDLNVPMKAGVVKDEARLLAVLPTIKLLHERGAKTILMSHLGRPEGKPSEEFSLFPVSQVLSERLGLPVAFALDCIGTPARSAVEAMQDGDILMLENLRFHAEEEKNNPTFVKALASLGDLYVNDAFGTAHRAHASTEGIAHRLPSAAGLLMESELENLTRLTSNPEHPFICIIGGSKIADKVRVFESLMQKVDAFVVGGGMANTFLAAQGKPIGTSLRDTSLAHAQRIITLAELAGKSIHLPVDAIAAPGFNDDDQAAPATLDELGERMILDIGPKTSEMYGNLIRTAKTIIFNGPMGVYEKEQYRSGTLAVCQAIDTATKNGATSVVGGGDAAAASRMLGFGDAFTHVSTGGGAMLEFLDGVTLPGVAALKATEKV
jgi:phosphoglycerate kinase